MILLFVLQITDTKAENLHEWDISAKNIELSRSADYLANRKRWKEARSYVNKISDKTIRNVFLWRQFTAGSKHTIFKEITDFINNNPKWPYIELLRKKAEESINDDTPPQQIINWFTERKSSSGYIISYKNPVTPRGKRILANTMILLKNTIVPKQIQIDKLIRKSWIEEDFTKKEELEFLKKHSHRLKPDDYEKRIDRLLWENKITNAKRIISKIDKSTRKLFEVRIKLKTSKFGLDNAIANLPKHFLKDSGFLYDRIKWREKYKNGKGVIDILKYLPVRVSNPRKFWKIKKKYINDSMKRKDYDTAYSLAKNHGFSFAGKNADISGFAEAEWLAGWISLRFRKNAKAAYQHFFSIYNKVKTPISLSRAAYWSARAAAYNNNNKISHKWYRIASKYSMNFYGQLAAHKLAGVGKAKLHIQQKNKITAHDIIAYRNNELMKATYILYRLKHNKLARKFLKHAVMDKDIRNGEKKLMAEFGLANGRPDYSVIIAKQSAKDGENIFLKAKYPQLDTLKNVNGKNIEKPEAALIHAIILQESAFDKEAKSRAGALGLMQLMPKTAKEVAKISRVPYNKKKLTSDVTYNITLGSSYLGRMIKVFENSYILGIASYNGGIGNVRKWIKANGDPRKLKDTEEIIDWIEKIPFSETQNYVQRVLENMQVYRYVLNPKTSPTINLEEDLLR